MIKIYRFVVALNLSHLARSLRGKISISGHLKLSWKNRKYIYFNFVADSFAFKIGSQFDAAYTLKASLDHYSSKIKLHLQWGALQRHVRRSERPMVSTGWHNLSYSQRLYIQPSTYWKACTGFASFLDKVMPIDRHVSVIWLRSTFRCVAFNVYTEKPPMFELLENNIENVVPKIRPSLLKTLMQKFGKSNEMSEIIFKTLDIWMIFVWISFLKTFSISKKHPLKVLKRLSYMKQKCFLSAEILMEMDMKMWAHNILEIHFSWL